MEKINSGPIAPNLTPGQREELADKIKDGWRGPGRERLRAMIASPDNKLTPEQIEALTSDPTGAGLKRIEDVEPLGPSD